MQLVSKISNLCDPDPPTFQTDRRTERQTDDMQSQYRALHYSASRSKNMINTQTVKHWRIHGGNTAIALLDGFRGPAPPLQVAQRACRIDGISLKRCFTLH